ncbi:adenylate/guanylate cyclase domain-containing protein [Methyloceanibacter sp. wino2]|uniref:adenylate/guanylate cyclase domain-containing protein n=1 Tax=Methyloceanibacter sp. wino2 TaxID=2170729 RepID=UPI00131F451E|nr:adenylate/guanylate cyclase domain-containing protein [Methyloceanibacter sp. wino2]
MRISFRATLLTLMLAVLLTAVALLGTAAYLYARFAVQDLGAQVLTQASERVEQHVQHALDVAEDEADTVARLITEGWIDPDDEKRLSTYFAASLEARPSLSYMSFGMPSGKYFHAFRDRDGVLTVLWLTPEDDGSRYLREFTVLPGEDWQVLRDIPNSKRTPPYERPYYLSAKNAETPIWTESYVFLGSGESLDVPGVSRAVPAVGPDGEFVGVLTADFDLYALSRFLRDVKLGSAGISFLLEVTDDGARRVIAHPAAADPDAAKRIDLTQPAPDDGGRVTIRAEDIADPRVANFLEPLGTDLSGVPASLQEITFEADGRTYLGSYRHLGREGGPNWIIGMALPEDEIFGDVQRMAQLMVYLGLGGVLVAAALSVLLSKRIAGYLRAIADETRRIGQFRLDPKPPVQSRIREISTLATAVEEMKTGLRSFQKYVPADLVRLLLESGEEAKLGGARTEITVYFSDLEGFTSISETLPPDTLVDLLARYLDEMTGEILDHGGTVDKFIGDGIMALWGAPRSHGQDALGACRAALANRGRLAKLRDIWAKEGLPLLRTRTGIHTGSAMVGNFGSPNRLDYTAIGDTVNVASRLEGLNHIYGTDILISDVTRRAVDDVIVTRPIDKVAVKGRQEGLVIYALIGERDALSKDEIALAQACTEAMDLYFSQEWEAAAAAFAAILKQKPDDEPAKIMRDRCEAFAQSPPPADWDGLSQTEKR